MLALGIWCCCDERPSKVSDMSGRMDFAFDWAAKVKFDVNMRFDFNGDFSSWAKFSSATSINLNFQFGGLSAYKRQLSADLDDDGVEETVRLLAFASGDPAAPERVMVAWRGDAYTYDADRCYVMWWEGTKLQLLNGRCGSDEPALHCEMSEGKSSTLSCDVCSANGTCSTCDRSSVSDCIDEGERKLNPVVGAAGSSARGGASSLAGSAGTPGLAGTAGEASGHAGEASGFAGAAGTSARSGGGASSVAASVGTSVSVEFDTCQSQVRSLSSTAASCNRTLRDPSRLCSDSLTDVNVCYVAIQGAGLFGSACSVFGSDVCQGVRQ